MKRNSKLTIANIIVEKWNDNTKISNHKIPVIYIDSLVEYYQVDFYYPGKNNMRSVKEYIVQLIDYGLSKDHKAIKNIVDFGDITIGHTKLLRYDINSKEMESNRTTILNDLFMSMYSLSDRESTNLVSQLNATVLSNALLATGYSVNIDFNSLYNFFIGTDYKIDRDNPDFITDFLEDEIEDAIDRNYFSFDKSLYSKLSEAKEVYDLGKEIYSYYSKLSNTLNFKHFSIIFEDMALPKDDNGLFYQSFDQSVSTNKSTLSQVKSFDINKSGWPEYNIKNISERLDKDFYENKKAIKKYGEKMVDKDLIIKLHIMHNNALGQYSDNLNSDKEWIIKKGTVLMMKVYDFLLNKLPIS